MKSIPFVLFAFVSISFANPVSLFNGKDLAGWTADIPQADKESGIAPSFIVRDGLLVSLGKPMGHLITQDSYTDFTLTVEYRFPNKPGNCGVLVHASKPRVRNNLFPQAIEVQLMHQNAGDFWCIMENIEVPEMEKRRPRKTPDQQYGGGENDARNIVKLAPDAENPLGSWNIMTIHCEASEIIVHVNGKLMNHGTNCTTRSGKIALQAEGAEVEFRKIELTKLKP